MNKVRELIYEYEEGRKELIEYIKTLPDERPKFFRNYKLIRDSQRDQRRTQAYAMLRDIEYALKWMRDGYDPNRTKGIDKKDGYKNIIKLDPGVLQRYYSESVTLIKSNDSNVIDMQQSVLESVMAMLSKREKDAYILVRANEYTFAEAAEALNITKASVQKYIERAEKKISDAYANDLFFQQYLTS